MKRGNKDWITAISYFNSCDIGSVIKRSDYLSTVQRGNRTESILDSYRKWLIGAGFLEYIDRGEYRRIKDIPDTITTKDCRLLAYNKVGDVYTKNQCLSAPKLKEKRVVYILKFKDDIMNGNPTDLSSLVEDLRSKGLYSINTSEGDAGRFILNLMRKEAGNPPIEEWVERMKQYYQRTV